MTGIISTWSVWVIDDGRVFAFGEEIPEVSERELARRVHSKTDVERRREASQDRQRRRERARKRKTA